MKPSLSIVIPVFNEEKRLKKTFSEIKGFLEGNPINDLEIIFVNDGSSDKTEELIKNFRTKIPIKIISGSENKGKGHAVRTGVLASAKDYCLIVDADMSTSFEELNKMIPFMERNYPVIIGTRKVKGAKMIPPQPVFRKKLGEGYTMLANLITRVGISDFTCGFKCFSATARDTIFSKAVVDGWSYDAELLYLAKEHNLDICEVPVIWKNDIDTRVKLGKDVLGSLKDLIKIRLRKY